MSEPSSTPHPAAKVILDDALQRRGISLRELARRLGVTAASISRAVREQHGYQGLDPVLAERIAIELQMPVDQAATFCIESAKAKCTPEVQGLLHYYQTKIEAMADQLRQVHSLVGELASDVQAIKRASGVSAPGYSAHQPRKGKRE